MPLLPLLTTRAPTPNERVGTAPPDVGDTLASVKLSANSGRRPIKREREFSSDEGESGEDAIAWADGREDDNDGVSTHVDAAPPLDGRRPRVAVKTTRTRRSNVANRAKRRQAPPRLQPSAAPIEPSPCVRPALDDPEQSAPAADASDRAAADVTAESHVDTSAVTVRGATSFPLAAGGYGSADAVPSSRVRDIGNRIRSDVSPDDASSPAVPRRRSTLSCPAVGIDPPGAVGISDGSSAVPLLGPRTLRSAGLRSATAAGMEAATAIGGAPPAGALATTTHMLYRRSIPNATRDGVVIEGNADADAGSSSGEKSGSSSGGSTSSTCRSDKSRSNGRSSRSKGGRAAQSTCRLTTCRRSGCPRRPSFGDPGDSKASWCASHKKDGQIDVTSRRCEHEGCDRIPSFRYIGTKGSRFCAKHKLPGMADYHRDARNCKMGEGCTRNPSFGFKGEKRISCAEHKQKGMINLNIVHCHAPGGCKLTPGFAMRGNPPTFCARHKGEGMVNVVSKRCQDDECDRIPSYGWDVDGAKAAFCATHKEEGMVNVRHPRCAEDGCRRQPGFGKAGGKLAVFCKEHKKPDMVDVKNLYAKRKKKKGSKMLALY